ncbi:hypothetical protein Vafri_64 [Volvox africanus]|nr:hypothetical protein Vafri_64 [Volvox africanus]
MESAGPPLKGTTLRQSKLPNQDGETNPSLQEVRNTQGATMNVAHGYPTRSQRKKPGIQGATAGGSLETSFAAASRATPSPAVAQGRRSRERTAEPLRSVTPGRVVRRRGLEGHVENPISVDSPTRDVCPDGQGPALTAAPQKGSSGQDQDGTLTRAPDQLAPAPGQEAGTTIVNPRDQPFSRPSENPWGGLEAWREDHPSLLPWFTDAALGRGGMSSQEHRPQRFMDPVTGEPQGPTPLNRATAWLAASDSAAPLGGDEARRMEVAFTRHAERRSDGFAQMQLLWSAREPIWEPCGSLFDSYRTRPRLQTSEAEAAALIPGVGWSRPPLEPVALPNERLLPANAGMADDRNLEPWATWAREPRGRPGNQSGPNSRSLAGRDRGEEPSNMHDLAHLNAKQEGEFGLMHRHLSRAPIRDQLITLQRRGLIYDKPRGPDLANKAAYREFVRAAVEGSQANTAGLPGMELGRLIEVRTQAYIASLTSYRGAAVSVAELGEDIWATIKDQIARACDHPDLTQYLGDQGHRDLPQSVEQLLRGEWNRRVGGLRDVLQLCHEWALFLQWEVTPRSLPKLLVDAANTSKVVVMAAKMLAAETMDYRRPIHAYRHFWGPLTYGLSRGLEFFLQACRIAELKVSEADILANATSASLQAAFRPLLEKDIGGSRAGGLRPIDNHPSRLPGGVPGPTNLPARPKTGCHRSCDRRQCRRAGASSRSWAYGTYPAPRAQPGRP